MNSNMYIPFTYHIAWTEHNLHYYGVKFASGCHPDDLWNPYKTSSKVVKVLIKSIGDPDIIEVRKEFDTKEQATDWELRVLKRLGVIKREDWINECAFPVRVNKFSDEHREKISKAHRGKKLSQKTKDRISKSKQGFVHSEKSKQKMSEASKGHTRNLGCKHSDEHNKNKSELMKNLWLNDPSRKVKQSERMTEYYKDPLNRLKTAQTTREMWKIPGHREKVSVAVSKGLKGKQNALGSKRTQKQKEAKSIQMKEMWRKRKEAQCK